MNLKIEKGQTVNLICCESCKLHLYKDREEYKMVHGYTTGVLYPLTSNIVEEVTIEGFIGDSIIGTNGKLYPLAAEFDNGFYSIIT